MNVSGGSEIRRQESPARFLPLISTAEMTLSHLCSAGDEDARALFRALGLNEDEIPDSPATILSPEQRLTRTAFLETRRCVTDALAELTEASLYADLPCGLSPRALRWARKERTYLGLDLPPVVEAIRSATLPLLEEKKRPFVRFAAADATDPDALVRAVGTDGGEVCVMTEGLLVYFSQQETRLLCEGIRRLLVQRGGCWITADPEMHLQIFLTLRAVCGESLSRVLQGGFPRKPVRGGKSLPKRPADESPLQIKPGPDVPARIEQAMVFLNGCGLQAERIPMACLTEAPVFPEILTPVQRDAMNDALEKVSIWVVTLRDS